MLGGVSTGNMAAERRLHETVSVNNSPDYSKLSLTVFGSGAFCAALKHHGQVFFLSQILHVPIFTRDILFTQLTQIMFSAYV